MHRFGDRSLVRLPDTEQVEDCGPRALYLSDECDGYNLSQPESHGGQVGDDLATTTFTIRASDTMEARLLLGIGYVF